MTDVNVAAELTHSAIALRFVGTRALTCNSFDPGERDKVASISKEIHRIADEIEQLSVWAKQIGPFRSIGRC